MKLNKNLIIQFSILLIVVALYYLNVKEGFIDSTLEILANLPPWLIYLIIVIYGIKTAGDLGGRAINGYFGKKNNTKIIPVTPINGK